MRAGRVRDSRAKGRGAPRRRRAARVPALAAGWAFFLDIDGTLLEFALRPDGVRVTPALRALLARLRAAAGGALALVSGRRVATVEALFAPLKVPCAGLHGAERRDADGRLRRHTVAPPAPLRRARVRLARLVRERPGLLLEDKGLSLALHYRGAPQLGALAAREMRRIAAQAGRHFALQAGNRVLELKPAGRDKGTAIAEFMAEPPFAGRVPVFVGDDRTDEHGFALVNRLGGYSVKVGAGSTRARWRLADSRAVQRWLAAYARRYAPRASRASASS